MPLEIDPEVRRQFPGVEVPEATLRGVHIAKVHPELASFSSEVAQRVRAAFTLESVKDLPEFRAYRDFFWRIGIDPTKIRPAAEALLRRLVQGKELSSINTFVDAYNLASIETRIAIAAFDLAKLGPTLQMRFARAGESFLGIGMAEPKALKGNELVVSDGRELVAIYPYRDAEGSKVTEQTRDVLLHFCGVPGISRATLEAARDRTVAIVQRFCGGTLER